MNDRFTEQDSIRIAEASRDNITGEIDHEPYADCLTVCPLLTAGALANPNYERGGVACLGDSCAFYDIDQPNPDERGCSICGANNQAELTAEFVKMIYQYMCDHV